MNPGYRGVEVPNYKSFAYERDGIRYGHQALTDTRCSCGAETDGVSAHIYYIIRDLVGIKPTPYAEWWEMDLDDLPEIKVKNDRVQVTMDEGFAFTVEEALRALLKNYMERAPLTENMEDVSFYGEQIRRVARFLFELDWVRENQ